MMRKKINKPVIAGRLINPNDQDRLIKTG